MAVVVIAGDRGGTGKDLVSEGGYLAALRRGLVPSLYEVETSRRLGLLYPEATFIDAGVPTAEDIYRNPDALLAPLDDAASRWAGDALAIVNLGANVTSALLSWAETNGPHHFGTGANLTFAVVLTMNRHALASGLSNLYDINRRFPAARRIAVLNEFIANFVEGDQIIARQLEQARGDGLPIETLKLRRMVAPAWGHLQNLGPLTQVAQMPPEELIGLGLPAGPAIRSLALLERWLDEDLIGPLDALLPEAAEAAKSRPKRRASEERA